MICLNVSSSVLVMPDELNITIGINVFNVDRAEAQKLGVDELNRVVDLLKQFNEKVTTGCKATREHRIQVEDKSDKSKVKYKYVRDGYTFTTSVFATFSSDYEKVDELFEALEGLSENCTLGVSYSISDVEYHKDRLLSKLVYKAQDKAAILAKASGRKLGKIIDITNTSQAVDYYQENAKFACNSVSYRENMGANMAKPIEVSNSITVTFEL